MSSSMIAKAAALKPEIRLAQSVSEFEASPSDEHKATFRSYRSQSLNTPLDPSDVMRLTAEIDRRAVQQNGGGQCFGPRLTNILQAVQQYAALGDVIIGGSQNIVACGIWSLLRLTLLALVSFSSYMEKLSRLLMVAGRKAPRYEQMALLYPRSSDLQSSLSEYFIVVVQLCRQLYKATQKTTFGSYFSFLSDLDLKEHETSLQLWADCIKDEVTLLTARKITEQSNFLGVLSKNSDYQTHRQRLRTRLRILEACSTYDHQTTWKEIRKSGTSTLLTLLDQYPEWKAETASSTFLCTGKLGFGKSVLLANMVDDLNLSTKPAGTAVTYFFCRHDIQDSLRARTIIGSIARQLIDTNLSQLPDEFPGTTSASDLESLLELILPIITKTTGAFIVLDGLDECDDDDREATLRCLGQLQKTFPLKVCCSFRSDMHLRAAQEAADILISSNVIHLPEDNPDISSFIAAELRRCIQSNRLCIGDASLIADIQHALVHRAQGMFLWVILQIASLCTAQSDEEIRDALEDLPKGLSETFSRILKKCRGTGEKYQKLILQLCVAARRPLTTEELREALSVAPYNIEWNPARLINNIFAVLACCGSLITVDEEHLTVRLLHHSVKQYLLGDFDPLDEPIMTLEDADKSMGEAIITYLNYDEFENAMSKTVFQEIPAQEIPSSVAKSVLRHSSPVGQVALKWFQRRRSYQHDLRDALIPKRERTTENIKFDFHHYAKTFWLCHVQWSLYKGSKAVSLLLRLLKKSRININDTDEQGKTLLWKAVGLLSAEAVQSLINYGANTKVLGENGFTILHLSVTRGCDQETIEILLARGAEIEAMDANGRTAVLLAAEGGFGTIIAYLLDKGANIEAKDNEGLTPWLLAAQAGQIHTLLLLRQRGANTEAMNFCRRTAVSLAALGNQLTLMRFLLANYADCEAKDDRGATPLHQAAEGGHISALALLLNYGANINACNEDNATPLIIAAKAGHVSSLRFLLDRGALIEAKDKKQWTALLWAAFNGHDDIVRSLLQKKANIESKDGDRWTSLLLATSQGHKSIVQALIVHGVDVAALTGDGRSSVQLATSQGYRDIKEILLRYHALLGVKTKLDVVQTHERETENDGRSENAEACTDSEHDTALLLRAAADGHISVVKALLNQGMDNANARTSVGKTALHLSAEQGHPEIVQLLLKNGANVSERMTDGRTPLHLSAEQEHLKVVQLLLDNGANVGERMADSRTPLHLSAEQRHHEVVQLLLDNGANVGERMADGRTPLHLSAEQGHQEVVQLLLNYGANVGERMTDGRTPLHLSAGQGYLQVVKCLLSSGAVLDLKSFEGRSAVLFALEGGHFDLVRYLLPFGATLATR